MRLQKKNSLCMTTALTQPTLITTERLMAEGLDALGIRVLVQSGDLIRIRRGVYCAPFELDARELHVLKARATVPKVHADSVFSHSTAAAIHGLPLRQEDLTKIHVTRQGPGHGRNGPLIFLRRSTLDPADRDVMRGLPVTSLARTAVDLARGLPYTWAVIVLDAALRQGLAAEELIEQLERASNWRGIGTARAAAAFADARAESPLESLSRVQIDRLGLPRPELQFEITVNGLLIARTDFAWPDQRLIGEADGRAKYDELLDPGQRAGDVVMAEKRREQGIRSLGYWLVRWGWREANDLEVLGGLLRRSFALAPTAA